MPKKKKKKTGEVEELVLDEAAVPLPPAEKTPKPKVRKAPTGVEVHVYFAAKKIRKGHKPGMVAYAEQKLGKSIRRLKLSFEEWVELFSTY